ncbi:hypothetical protein ABZ690_24290 [Streptomyces sp. NPDC006967]|nr:hypothetical protein [Streptomyces sp. SM1]
MSELTCIGSTDGKDVLVQSGGAIEGAMRFEAAAALHGATSLL